MENLRSCPTLSDDVQINVLIAQLWVSGADLTLFPEQFQKIWVSFSYIIKKATSELPVFYKTHIPRQA